MKIDDIKNDYLEKIAAIRSLITKIGSGEALLESANTLEDDLGSKRAPIPVIGEFSSGKSTMLNSLLGHHLLPTAITPATSLPLELWQGTPERLEAFSIAGERETFAPEELKHVSEEADKWVYGRMVLDNESIAMLEPFYLVDMPGTSSPNQAHTAAILRYLEKGVHYIVLVDAGKGTIGASLLRKMKEISDAGKKFHLIMSKCDLVPAEDAEKTASHIGKLLRENFDFPVPLKKIANGKIDATDLFDFMHPAMLYRDQWTPQLLNLTDQGLNFCNIQINALKQERQNLDSALADLQAACDIVRKEADMTVAEIRSKGQSQGINEIIRSVRQALQGIVPEITTAVLAHNREEAENLLNETARSSLFQALQNQLGKFEREISLRFVTSLESLQKSLSQLDGNSGLQELLQQQLKEHLPAIQEWLQNKIGSNGGEKISALSKLLPFTIGSRTAGVMTAGILGSAANIVAPVLGLFVAFLPEILGALFGGETDRERMVSNKIEAEVIPGILNKIRRELPEQLAMQSEIIVEEIRKQFEADLQQKEAALENAKKAQEDTREELEAREKRLTACKKEFLKIMNQLLA